MSTLELLSRSDVLLIAAATIIIIFAIVITAVVQGTPGTPFAQITTVGPVWTTDAWLCTSTSDFIVHNTLIAYGKDGGASIEIFVSGQGTQPDFKFAPRDMQSFSIGGPAGSSVVITKNSGSLSGFLTIQTASNAIASCEAISG